MQRKCGELVPIGEVFGGLDGPRPATGHGLERPQY